MYCSFAKIVHADMLCSTVSQHTLYHVSVCTVLLPILHMPICSVPLSLNTHCIMSLYVLSYYQYCTCRYALFHCLIKLFTVYICSLFVFVIFLSYDIRFAMPDLVLPLFHFQPLLSDLPLTAIDLHRKLGKVTEQTIQTAALTLLSLIHHYVTL
jgi:hypothetical protein